MAEHSIIVTDRIAEEGLALLRDGGVRVEYLPGIPKDELLERIPQGMPAICSSLMKESTPSRGAPCSRIVSSTAAVMLLQVASSGME